MPRRAIGIEFHVEHPLGDDAPLALASAAGVLNGVLEIEKHARRVPESRSSTRTAPRRSKSAIALKRQIEHGVEQRMARTHECRQRLSLRRHQRLLERDAFVARKHRLADADQTVAVAHRRRNVRHLVAARFPLLGRAAQALEGLEKERLDVVRLQATRVGALHVFADAMHTAGVHRIVGQRPLLEEILELATVERVVKHLS